MPAKTKSRPAAPAVDDGLDDIYGEYEPNTARYDITPIVDEVGTEFVAARCGVTRRTVQRWVTNGVDEFTADRVAVKAGANNPAFVWGRAWA